MSSLQHFMNGSVNSLLRNLMLFLTIFQNSLYNQKARQPMMSFKVFPFRTINDNCPQESVLQPKQSQNSVFTCGIHSSTQHNTHRHFITCFTELPVQELHRWSTTITHLSVCGKPQPASTTAAGVTHWEASGYGRFLHR